MCPLFQPLPDVRAAHQANEALQMQLSQLRAQVTHVSRENMELKTQNHDLLWQVQKAQQQQPLQQVTPPPLRASTHNGGSSQEVHDLRAQVC